MYVCPCFQKPFLSRMPSATRLDMRRAPIEAYLCQSQEKSHHWVRSRCDTPPAKTLRNGLNVRWHVVTEALPGMCRAHPYITRQLVNRQPPQGGPADSRPIPLMTSSRINKAPYFLQTDSMALKYPFGAASAPVVAPTTVSATTLWRAPGVQLYPLKR